MIDDRNRELTLLGWLLHAAGGLPVVVGVAIYGMVSFGPNSSATRHTQERIAVMERLLKQSVAVRQEHSGLEVELADCKRRAAQARTRIPDEPNEAQYLRQLTEAAVQEGVVVDDYTRGTVSRRNDVSQLEIRLKCVGRYDQICGFLNHIENLPRASKIVSMTLSSGANQDVYPLGLTILLYFGVQQAPATNGEVANG